MTLANDTATHYSATCEWVTGVGTKGQKTHDITLSRHSGVNSTVAYDAGVKTQITGVTLKGFGDSTTDGTTPVEGQPCVGNVGGIDFNGTWTSVAIDSRTSVLSVAYGGTSVSIG
ncbi:hypothetical protein ACWDCC_16140 [Streptomyces sp. NPDC001102]